MQAIVTPAGRRSGFAPGRGLVQRTGRTLAVRDVQAMKRKRGRPRIDWTGTDWSRKLAEIAAERGVSVASAGNGYHRTHAGRKPYTPHSRAPHPSKAFWDSVKWNGKTTAEIAEQTGRSIGRAWQVAHERGWKLKRGYHVLFDFRGVDWSQRDVTIAERLGCTRERVRQMRKKLRKHRPN